MRIEALVNSGAVGIALPLERTRMGIQTAVDSATKAGLAAWGWIEVGGGPDSENDDTALDKVRRLAEAYPNLDGYFLRGLESLSPEFLSECRELVFPHLVVPVLTNPEHLLKQASNPAIDSEPYSLLYDEEMVLMIPAS